MSENAWSKLWVRVLIIALFVFALYSNIGLIIQNYHISAQVDAAQSDVDRMTLRNQQLSLLLSYYQSPSYQDVEARRRLGMKRPDENVYVVNGITVPNVAPSDQLESTVYQSTQAVVTDSESNISRWLKYFEGKSAH